MKKGGSNSLGLLLGISHFSMIWSNSLERVRCSHMRACVIMSVEKARWVSTPRAAWSSTLWE